MGAVKLFRNLPELVDDLFSLSTTFFHRFEAANGAIAVARAGDGPAGWSTPAFGNEMHRRFRDALVEQTGTKRSDWLMRTGPGQTGVDATYVGPASRDPGFEHAELKPASGNGFYSFLSQVQRWLLPPGSTTLWFYNPAGIIGQTRTTF